MIEIGTVTQHLDGGRVTVEFKHLGTTADCHVLQSTTGANTTYAMPSVGTQVVCNIESGKNIALGAIFSENDKTPEGVSTEGLSHKIGNTTLAIDNDRVTFENDSTSLRTLLEDLLNIVQNITVSTPMGASGTPLPPTIHAAEQLKLKYKQFFK